MNCGPQSGRIWQSHTLFEVFRGGMDELKSDELEATLLESADDVADDSALDTVGLKHVGYMGVRIHWRTRRRVSAYLDHDIGTFGDRHGV